jgi:hypothetical protein
MDAPHPTPSPSELTTEVNGLLTGFGILTTVLFPIALPGLLLALPLALLVAPLALAALPVLLLARLLRRRQ